MITLVVFTDGRAGLIEQALASFDERVDGSLVTRRIIVDDSADYRWQAHLEAVYGERFELIHHGERRGFCGAIVSGWNHFLEGDEEFLFHLEDDFTFNRDVNLAEMVAVLDHAPYVAQVALRRQAWNKTEKKAGGVIEVAPDEYLAMTNGQEVWLEHRLFWTTNPSLYRRCTVEGGWPTEAYCEGVFTHRLIADEHLRFAYFGKRTDDPWVHHIGDHRAGTGY